MTDNTQDKAIEAAIAEACKYIKVENKAGFPEVTLENMTQVINKAITAYNQARWQPISEIPNINKISVIAKLHYSDHYQIIMNIDGEWYDCDEIVNLSNYTHWQPLPTPPSEV